MHIADIIKEEIDNQGRSMRYIAKQSKIDYDKFRRFIARDRNLGANELVRVLMVLRWNIVDSDEDTGKLVLVLGDFEDNMKL